MRTSFESAAGDPGFQAVGSQAMTLGGVATLVALQVPPGAAIINVGAPRNQSAILLTRSVGRVAVLKPSLSNVASPYRNLELNGITTAQVRASAVPGKPGGLRFQMARLGAEA